MPQIQVPEDSPPVSGGVSKRTLLIGAAILGGGVGLVLLVSRLSHKNTVNASTNQPTTSAPDTSALGIGYQNLATQLLGFRGDMSVVSAQTNADLSTLNDSITAATSATQAGNHDLLSAIGAESTTRALSDQTLYGMLANWFSGVVQNQNASATNIMAHQDQSATNVIGAINASGSNVIANQNASATNVIGAVNASATNVMAQRARSGAGGATLRDSVLATFDGGLGDGAEGLARLSAGPVRVVSRAA